MNEHTFNTIMENALLAARGLDCVLQSALWRISRAEDRHEEFRIVDPLEHPDAVWIAHRLGALRRIELIQTEPTIVFRELEPRDD